VPVLVQHQILRLQVPEDDAVLVKVLKREVDFREIEPNKEIELFSGLFNVESCLVVSVSQV